MFLKNQSKYDLDKQGLDQRKWRILKIKYLMLVN